APDSARLSKSLRRYIRARPGRISVAVLDFVTGTMYRYAPRERFDAASTVKMQILGTALWHKERAHSWLTRDEQLEAKRMIEESDNDEATIVWDADGGAPAVQRFDDRVPMLDTTANAAWGLTQVTAEDEVRLLRRFVTPNSLLGARARAFALDLMEHVTSSQRWGVSAGVPAGVTVALKNGWLQQPSTEWTVASMGWIHGAGRDYAIAVLTDRNETERAGIRTIQGVSRRVFASLKKR
ncbi:MAG: hypothetical protein QOG85_1879, partial [Gaiellaceae bacterium]|nr:hypothetical protein [Gaiellaceae bacterium]